MADMGDMREKRYGFPNPERDANGERCYPFDQVERLRLMKRLIDQGHRPGNLMRLLRGISNMKDEPAAPTLPLEPTFDRTPQPFGFGPPDPIVCDARRSRCASAL